MKATSKIESFVRDGKVRDLVGACGLIVAGTVPENIQFLPAHCLLTHLMVELVLAFQLSDPLEQHFPLLLELPLQFKQFLLVGSAQCLLRAIPYKILFCLCLL
jgi:hypothetical protein